MLKHTILVYLLIIIGLVTVTSIAQDGNSESKKVTVAIKTFEPFVMQQGDEWTGFSIELWEFLAQNIDLDFEYKIVQSVSEQIAIVEDGQADLAIAGISITSVREERIDFSQPYFDAGLHILAPSERTIHLGDLLVVLLSPSMVEVFGLFLASVIVASHVIWLLERRQNPDFPTPYIKGIGEALWWSVVTVTTVGYGDKAPKGLAGRFFGVIWMLMGLFLIANFTAGVTSSVTLQELRGSINSLSDLRGQRIGSVAGSTSVDYLNAQGFNSIQYQSIDSAYTALSEQN